MLNPTGALQVPLVFCYVGTLIAGEREMQSYRLPFLAIIALWLLPIQAIAAERPVLGQGNISCSLWLEGRQTDSPSTSAQ
jgi:hypothetical protein